MGGSLFTEFFLREEHEVQRLLARCLAPQRLSVERFDAFRQRALQRVAIEERVIAPDLSARGVGLPSRRVVRIAHHELVTVCVPTPHPEWLEELPRRLTWLSEMKRADGYYAACDRHLDPATLRRAQALPPIRIPPLANERRDVARRLTQLLRATGLIGSF